MTKKINAYEEYIKKFNKKINYFKDHRNYEWLRKYSDDAIRYYGTMGLLQIKAEDFIERVIAANFETLQDRLDGKNQLEWSII